ncbi:Attractin-like protein 1 [Microtus ochrogaster]|uniref:Attractin-like protein 1 n=1 Tax=Microtus ochrogaster TaxID=79684 RepID=A0A8J6GLS5_MICOH|nr:Attractin-like protein 1 [Microtus ochrogaster]
MECMWCSSTERCVDSNAYIISFPYGQCLEWQTATCSPQNCSGLRTCGQCLEQPGCGWCNDPSNTGRGYCTEGSSRGPVRVGRARNSEAVLDTSLCPKEKNYEWSFIQCPACQCNGHSTCINNNVCEQCKNLTTGRQCEDCMPGYYGDPTNGGQCTDSLLIDYQFTFSLLQEDDRHHTAINFIANPEQSNKNLDISINASNNFNLNITWSVGSTGGTISGEETPIVSKTNIKEYRDSFSYEKFNFRSNPNITFYVYVSNFSWPIKIQIAFSQHNTIMDLVQFFVTFFRNPGLGEDTVPGGAAVQVGQPSRWGSRPGGATVQVGQPSVLRPHISPTVIFFLDVQLGAALQDLCRLDNYGSSHEVQPSPCYSLRRLQQELHSAPSLSGQLKHLTLFPMPGNHSLGDLVRVHTGYCVFSTGVYKYFQLRDRR